MGDLTDTLTGFARALRAAGVGATPDRVHALLAATDLLGATRRGDVYWAGRLTLCASPADLPRYDATFALWFSAAAPASAPVPPDPSEEDRAAHDGGGGAEQGETAAVARADAREVLRRRDLAHLREDERDAVRRLLCLLAPVGDPKPSRRRRPAARGETDARRTVRAALRAGGELTDVRRRRRRARPRRLLVVVDVSGSMAPYADAYLRFAHAGARARRGTEVFTIGTRLTRVTAQARRADPDLALRSMAAAVPDWSGGTRLGEQLRALLDRWGQRGAARGAVAVVLSDGWERGDATLLGEQLERLRRLAHRVVWVNPHEGKPGYAALTAGMRTVLPRVDDVVDGHTLEALERLCLLLRTPAVSRA